MVLPGHKSVGALTKLPRRLLRLGRWIARGTVAVVLTAAIAGAIFQELTSRAERRRFHPPGVLVPAFGRLVHLYCIGKGAPTVVLESGLGDDWLIWYAVQPEVSRTTRVCSYDRPGLGWSAPATETPDSRHVAVALEEVLRLAGERPPFVLVGHSLGGLHVRMYATLFPGEVTGMVLVDAAHPYQSTRLPPPVVAMQDRTATLIGIMEWMAPFGLPRLVGVCGGEGPPAIRAMAEAVECHRQSLKAVRADALSFEHSQEEVRASGSLGDLPLVVLSHDPQKPFLQSGSPELVRETDSTWSVLQTELVHLSSRGEQLIATGSGHYIQVDRPDLVISAIRRVVGQTTSP